MSLEKVHSSMSYQITFLRHGKADRSVPNDRLRPLSTEGIQQARSRREMLNNPKYDLILHSSRRRTRETAILVAGLGADASTIEIPELFYENDSPDGKAFDLAFAQLGHVPLAEYLKLVKDELASFARRAWMQISMQIEQAVNSKANTRFLVVGHGILTQATCVVVTGKEEPFADETLGECHGFEILVDTLPGRLIRSLR
jgi:phosphohistidine phosphatase SixA